MLHIDSVIMAHKQLGVYEAISISYDQIARIVAVVAKCVQQWLLWFVTRIYEQVISTDLRNSDGESNERRFNADWLIVSQPNLDLSGLRNVKDCKIHLLKSSIIPWLLVDVHPSFRHDCDGRTTITPKATMDAEWMIAAFLVIEHTMEQLGHWSDARAQAPTSDVITVAVVAANSVQNHHEQASRVMRHLRSLSGSPRGSRCNRRWSRRADWVAVLATALGELFARGDVFIIDRLPLPVYCRVRARRGRNACGRVFCGYCAAKHERFFGWRLHLICTPNGVPVSFQLLPAVYHDLTPLHEVAVALPPGARLIGDKAFVSAADAASLLADTGVRLVAARREKMRPQHWSDELAIRTYRRAMETVNRHAEKMGIQRLHARANAGREGAKQCFAPPVVASLIALAITNAD